MEGGDKYLADTDSGEGQQPSGDSSFTGYDHSTALKEFAHKCCLSKLCYSSSRVFIILRRWND